MNDPKSADQPSLEGSANATRPARTSRRRTWILLAALIGLGGSLWLAASLLRERPPLPQINAQRGDRYPSATVYRKGHLNGTPIAIRGDYLGHPITYTDKSDWEPASSPDYYEKKTYTDAILGFDVVLHWPSMEPHKPSNHDNWLTYRSFRPSEWISIAVVGDLKPEARPPYKTDNGLARVIKGEMEHVVRSPRKRRQSDGQLRQVDLRYELLGYDSALGLNVARTVGRDADKPGVGNDTLFWFGDLAGIVETSIDCPAGILPNPASVHTCTQMFEMLELGAYVSVHYTENLLPQWRQIETRAREFILSLRIDPNNPSTR